VQKGSARTRTASSTRACCAARARDGFRRHPEEPRRCSRCASAQRTHASRPRTSRHLPRFASHSRLLGALACRLPLGRAPTSLDGRRKRLATELLHTTW
jgi:hypothetical protein